MDRLLPWLWLSLLNLSPRAVSAVLQETGDALEALRAPDKAFHGLRGVTPREAEELENRDLAAAEFSLRRCREQKLQVLALSDDRYPERLRQTPTPPALLLVQGSLPDLEAAPVLAVIGTRRASAYGMKMSRNLARELAACGGTVLSLLTPGADEAAAEGAILAERPALGVLGTAHEACRWPVARRFLAAGGALVSEYPPGKEQGRHFFRERNRVAAALSDGVVVVEAPEKSGTRLFVRDAAELGKDVFAVPGNVDAETSAGTLALLKEGAKLVTCSGDILEEYLLRYPGLRTEPPDPEEEAPRPAAEEIPADKEPAASAGGTAPQGSDPETLRAQLSGLSADQLRLIAAISPPSTHVDEIAERSGLPVSRVLSQLTVLEIKGYVRREPGRYFSLNI